MTHDLIGSKKEMYNKLQSLNKEDFVNEYNKLMINGKWGSGKSYLIDAIKKLANEKDINVLVIDAWRLEYLQEPERMVMVELLSSRELNVAGELSSAVIGKAKELFDEYVKEVDDDDFKVEKIFKRSIKMTNTLKNNSNEYKYMELLDELSFNCLDERLLEKLNIDIIIFDELDRVLPETFIEIIKFIKYFTTRNSTINITAALNLEQCNSMIKHLYGDTFHLNYT